MKTDLLSRISGELTALFCLPLNKALGNDGTNHNAGWQAAYHKKGLPFGNSRSESEALRGLVADGLLETQGSTLGKSYKLTVKGIQAVMAESWADTGALLARIIQAQEQSRIISPYGHHNGATLAMAWHLIPDAGEWLQAARKTDAAWREYIGELCRLQGNLAGLLILGYVNLHHDGQGQIWGLMATAEGREAVKAWPVAVAIPDESDELLDSWTEGHIAGLSKYGNPPPADFKNVLACRLPQGGWTSR